MPETAREEHWVPATDVEREAVREQVGRIVASTLFRNSRRYPRFLQYTVERTLQDQAEPLKERTIGVDVFGREPDYDTAQDPIVRMTAGEIRKRLARYYDAPGHETEIRVSFPSGSYRPEFRLPGPPPLEADAVTSPAAVRAPRVSRRVALAAAVAAVAAAGWWALPSRSDALDAFWSPVVASPAPVLVCVGAANSNTGDSSADPGDESQTRARTTSDFLRDDNVRFTDSLTLTLVTGQLNAMGKEYRVRRPDTTGFQDLREGPVILIGGFNNVWTLTLSEGLRYTLATTPDGRRYIRDRLNPSHEGWSTGAPTTPLADVRETYGIITRVHDPRTGHVVVMTSGLLQGTRAAGECLTHPACLAEARSLAPGDWAGRNLQIVVSTSLIGETSGAPKVVGAHLW